MNPVLVAYTFLGFAILCEVAGSALLQQSQQFTKLVPTVGMALLYLTSFYLLSQSLRELPLGVTYAIWAGLGIVLTAFVSVLVFKQPMDLWGGVGIAMIVGGVVIMNTLSKTATH
ncbi:DMT family transporter [Devosia sp. LjRoot3]|uniref:DMT family transporter n=1 Tax=Devosia sp. LjRoot3 TaxID=3342319 RepID=UPI003ECF0D2A